MSEVTYLTAEGADRLRNELDFLKGPSRDALAQRLRAAIEQGDLSENADYTAAKEEQGFLEGRIQELDRVLSNVVIIQEKSQPRQLVEIGAHITIQEEGDTPETYHLVGPNEADPRTGRISHESPIGKALMGHAVGETITAETPNGSIKFVIKEIK
jgi:transcription elongation factor GreA